VERTNQCAEVLVGGEFFERRVDLDHLAELAPNVVANGNLAQNVEEVGRDG
jgi:hypothetical protein